MTTGVRGVATSTPRRILAALALMLVVPSRSTSAPEPVAHPAGVDTVVVTGTRTEKPRSKVPASVSVVEGDAGRKFRPTLGLEEPLRRVPGVFVQNSGNYAQDFRLQIRGFGTRAAFGIREVTLLVDGLPETLADGQTQLDTIELGAVQRIEVMRGAGAALYGNAAGGVIHLFTDPPPDAPGTSLRVSGGSYGTFKAFAQAGGWIGRVGGIGTASHFQTDGYREHSAARSTTFLGRVLWQYDDRTQLRLLLDGAHAPEAQDPGGITGEQANADPRQARDLNVRLDAGESVDQVRLGLTADRDTDTGALAGYLFALHRDFDSKLPILPSAGDGIVQFDRVSPGGGARSTWDPPVLGWEQALTVGFDAQHQHDDRQRFANEDGQKGALGLDQIERVTSFGVYLRESVPVTETVELSGGIRYDVVHYAVDVLTPADSGDSGSRTMDAWNPGGGGVWNATEALSFFGNVATAFQAPTTTELVNPFGPGFNPNIQPQHAISYEVGLRFDGGPLEMGLALYRIDLRDELIPFETPAGRVAFRNAGRSRRWGLELDWQSEITPGLLWTGAATALRATYLEYQTDTGDFAGNREPGIPPWFVYQELSWAHPSGAYAAIEAQLVGGYFVDDANTATTPGYGLVNLRMGWEATFGGWQISPFLGLQNLTAARYDGTVRLNAFASRYYEPAPGFNLYGGLEIVPWAD